MLKRHSDAARDLTAWKRHLLSTLVFAIGLGLGPVKAQDRYLAVILGSAHIGVDLNDFNPGLLLGHRWQAPRDGVEYHLEAGIFYNSYEEVAPLVMGGVSFRLAELGSFDLRGGVSAGTGYYGTLAPILERDYGIPNIEGFIPLVAASIALRDTQRPVEYRLTALPGDAGVGVVNLSVAFDF
ncbi:hypothetical protein [Gymnodinialimonas hymeniacidonis]|uniref:hypothetical protein n=1 Tax=Gymnodinialimonas hymeniacidonis TaxID=3126508 RepID=UPI0034C647DF